MRETNDTSSVQISEEEGRENLSINKSGSQEREKASRSKERDKEMSAEKVNVADGGAGNQGSDRKQEPTEQELPNLTRRKIYIIVASLCVAIFLASLDNTIVATALPTIANHFNASSSISWIVAANFLTTTCFQPLYGKISDIFGRKEVLMGAIVIFVTGSLISGLAQSIPMLIFSRAFTGVGGAGMFVMVQIIISEMVSIQERGRYTGLIGVAVGLASVVGPLIGGIFTDKVSFRWCFLINLPVGLTAGVFIYFLVHTAKPKGLPVRLKIKRIDFQGAISLVSGLTMILLALNFGGNGSKWTGATVLCLLIFGFVMLGVFVFIELRVAKEPILPLHLFSIRNVWSIVSAQFFIGFSLYGLIYFIPLYDTIVNNASASKAGLFLLPFILSLVSFSICTGVAITKTGRYRIFFRSGAVSLAVGAGLLITLNEDTSSGLVKLFLVFCGAGCGMTMQSLIVCIQAAVPRRVIAGATSTVMFSRMLSGTVGNVMASVVYKSVVNSNASHLMQEYPASAEKIKAALDDTRLMHNLSLDPVISASLIDAYIKGLRDVFTMFCVVTSIGFLFTMATIHVPLSSPPPPPPPPQPEPNPT